MAGIGTRPWTGFEAGELLRTGCVDVVALSERYECAGLTGFANAIEAEPEAGSDAGPGGLQSVTGIFVVDSGVGTGVAGVERAW